MISLLHMAKATDETKVNFRSPKADIWNSYKDLLEQIQTGSPAIKEKSVSKLPEVTTNLKNSLTQEIDKIVSQINKSSQVLSEMQEASKNLEKETFETEKEIKIKREREEEEYNYEFEKRKKRQEEELITRKDEIKEMEAELLELRKEVSSFDAKLENAVKNAVATKEKELKLEFDHQKALTDQKSVAEISLIKQKVETLEETIKELRSENSKLAQSATQVSSQLTRIAEKAVEKGNTPQVDKS